MKTLITLLLASIMWSQTFAQYNETYIKDGNGNLVGTVSSYTNYVGTTETVLYDQNGQIVGSIEGDNFGPLLGANYSGQYTIVSGSDVSTVVLGNGTQALDYYLAVSKPRVSNRYLKALHKSYANTSVSKYPENVPHPEYLSVSNSQKNRIVNTETKMRKKGIAEDAILSKKLEMLETFMIKKDVLPIMIRERLKDMKKYHNSAKKVR